jgi:hypothetical protein
MEAFPMTARSTEDKDKDAQQALEPNPAQEVAAATTAAVLAEPSGEPTEQETQQVLAALRTGSNIPSGFRLNFDAPPYPKVEKIPDAEMKAAEDAIERERAEGERLAEEDAEMMAEVAPSHQLAVRPRRVPAGARA